MMAAGSDRDMRVPMAEPTPPKPLHARRVIKLVLELGSVLLATGARTADVETTIRSVASSLGAPDVQASVTFSSITVSVTPSEDEEPLTVVRLVRQRSSDYTRLAAASSLVRAVHEGRVDLDQAVNELAQIQKLPPPYPVWLLFVASAVSAAGTTVLFGGGLIDAAATLAIGLLAQPLVRRLMRGNIPPFFRVAFSTALVTALAVAAVGLGAPINGGLVVTGGLLRFLPGAALVAGMRDLIEQSIVSGSARLAEALLLAAAVALGATAALAAGGALGVSLTVSTMGGQVWMIPVEMVAAVAACVLYGVQVGIPRFALAGTAAVAAAGWFVYSGLNWTSDAILATGVSAAVIGVLAGFLARRNRTPATIWVVPATLPLLPGLLLVRGMLAGGGFESLTILATAVATAFILGVGAAGGDIAFQAFRRLDERVMRPIMRPAVQALQSGVDLVFGAREERASAPPDSTQT